MSLHDIASFQNSEQKLTKFVIFRNSRKFPPGILGMADSLLDCVRLLCTL